MQTGYNPYMSMYPYSCVNCPYMMQEQYQMQPYEENVPSEDTEAEVKEEEEDMYRRPPFGPRPPFYGPRPPFFGPPPFYGPRPPVFFPPPFFPPPFIPPPYIPPPYYPRPYPGLPFLTGLALGGLLF